MPGKRDRWRASACVRCRQYLSEAADGATSNGGSTTCFRLGSEHWVRNSARLNARMSVYARFTLGRPDELNGRLPNVDRRSAVTMGCGRLTLGCGIPCVFYPFSVDLPRSNPIFILAAHDHDVCAAKTRMPLSVVTCYGTCTQAHTYTHARGTHVFGSQSKIAPPSGAGISRSFSKTEKAYVCMCSCVHVFMCSCVHVFVT